MPADGAAPAVPLLLQSLRRHMSLCDRPTGVAHALLERGTQTLGNGFSHCFDSRCR